MHNNETIRYRAFGLVIESAFQIPASAIVSGECADVQIVPAELREHVDRRGAKHGDGWDLIFTKTGSIFRVSNGCLIEADAAPGDSDEYISVYLMGSCMGAILHQRGYMPIHGSCVTDGESAVLITGDSGAGKSTTAAEFLKRGWKLITDDVSAIVDPEGVPMVQSSYPSQKLWQDALDHYERPESDIHSLYFSDTREKFGVDVRRCFHEGRVPLSMIVRLIPANCPCAIRPIDGFARVDQLLKNTYRIHMIAPEHRQRHFQRCVTMSDKVAMAAVLRQQGVQCADIVFELITDYLGRNSHD